MSHRVLNEAVGQCRQHHRGEDQHDVVPRWQRGHPSVLRGDLEHRPVPQIEREGDQSDALERSQPEQAFDSVGRVDRAARDHERRPADRKSNAPAGIGGRGGEDDRGEHNGAETHPGRHAGERCGQPTELNGGHSDEAPEGAALLDVWGAGEKKAAVGLFDVCTIDQTKEATTATPRTQPILRRSELRNEIPATTRKMAGYTK